MRRVLVGVWILVLGVSAVGVDFRQEVQANRVAEVMLVSDKTYQNAFTEVELDFIVTQPGGIQLRVPAFWKGGNRWCFRYASDQTGEHTWRTECSDPVNKKLHGIKGCIKVVAYTGDNSLYRHGPIGVAEDKRHFAHADGTPFLWLGDTWWKCLCKRLTWEGFQELTADRKSKGFNVVQIVCGPYPDEDAFESRWKNEGGMPYLTRDFTVLNPTYFDYADRRFECLMDAGIIPAIVGAWARSDCDAMQAAGVSGLKRHWRYLVARYGAYPVVWILAGEVAESKAKWGKGSWGEVGKYLRSIDPYHRLITVHGAGRETASEKSEMPIIDFDMMGGSHDGRQAITRQVLGYLLDSYNSFPVMPVLCGETAYEGHMQQAFQDVQRHIFWMYMLNGAAGHTYGVAGVWHASVEGDPGVKAVYDWTTWREGMNYLGSSQVGLNKKLLEKYRWWCFESHPEWVEANSKTAGSAVADDALGADNLEGVKADCYAAGIPEEVRFIYQPNRGIYNWGRITVKNLERDVPYSVFYFDPASGRRFEQGVVLNVGPQPKPFEGHKKPLLFSDRSESGRAFKWKDYGTPSQRQDGSLVGTKGMVTILEKVENTDLMASVDAKSDAEAGIILRFHDADNYLVAIYSPLRKAIFFHDRQNGQWGAQLGTVEVPEIGPRIHLAAATCGRYAAMVLTDEKNTFYTPIVNISNVTSGKTGVWLNLIGERQEFSNFELSSTKFFVPQNEVAGLSPVTIINDGEYSAPHVPSPQDWILVLERIK